MLGDYISIFCLVLCIEINTNIIILLFKSLLNLQIEDVSVIYKLIQFGQMVGIEHTTSDNEFIRIPKCIIQIGFSFYNGFQVLFVQNIKHHNKWYNSSITS